MIAFKSKFNRIVLAAMQSNDPAVKQNGFALFKRGLRKIYTPHGSAPRNSSDSATLVYTCIFDPLHVMTKQKFDEYQSLGDKQTDAITPSLLKTFADLVPSTQAVKDEMINHRLNNAEEVLRSLLQMVLYMCDANTWPIPESLPSLFQYHQGVGFTKRATSKHSSTARLRQALQHRYGMSRGLIQIPAMTDEPVIHSDAIDAALASESSSAM
jgi:hypothetical protein